MQKAVWWQVMALVLLAESLWLIFLIVINIKALLPLLSVDGAGQIITLQISIIITLIAGLVWSIVTLSGAARKKPWARSSNLTIQVLFLAAAVGVLQGIIGQVYEGIVLLVIAIIGIAASLTLSKERPKSDSNGEL